MWKSQYLKGLDELDPPSATTLEIGQEVLVPSNGILKTDWKRAMVRNVEPSRDGVLRSVVLKMDDGTEITRPVNGLVSLGRGVSRDVKRTVMCE